MARLSVLVLAALTARAAGVFKSHSLRHAEESVAVVSESPAEDADAATTSVSEQLSAAPGSGMVEKMLVGTMGSLLQSQAEVMDPKSPKAKLQRQLVALIWLERVLKQNLDSMDEETYRAKIAQSKSGLEKDSTPATVEMLSRMRTEMHEFSVPFFQNAVKDELKDIRARQKAILDKIIAIDAGGDDAESEVASLSDADGEDDGSLEVKDDQGEKEEKKTKKTNKPKPAASENDDPEKAEKDRKNKQSNIFVVIMSAVGGTLVLIVLAIAIKVKTHVPSGV